jgi:hypothetical protein
MGHVDPNKKATIAPPFFVRADLRGFVGFPLFLSAVKTRASCQRLEYPYLIPVRSVKTFSFTPGYVKMPDNAAPRYMDVSIKRML